jgi:hypothetical protein
MEKKLVRRHYSGSRKMTLFVFSPKKSMKHEWDFPLMASFEKILSRSFSQRTNSEGSMCSFVFLCIQAEQSHPDKVFFTALSKQIL